jgi:hypothetical protein
MSQNLNKTPHSSVRFQTETFQTETGGGVPSNQPKSDFYHQEALRLLTMADSAIFDDVRDELTRMAHQYQRLAATAKKRDDDRFAEK